MSNIKKILALVLALVMVFALCACGENNTPAPEVVEKCIKLGRCTKEEADALIAAFNERYGDK